MARLRKALAQANMECNIIKTAANFECQVRVDSQAAAPLSRFRYLSCSGGLSCGLLPLVSASIVTASTRRWAAQGRPHSKMRQSYGAVCFYVYNLNWPPKNFTSGGTGLGDCVDEAQRSQDR